MAQRTLTILIPEETRARLHENGYNLVIYKGISAKVPSTVKPLIWQVVSHEHLTRTQIDINWNTDKHVGFTADVIDNNIENGTKVTASTHVDMQLGDQFTISPDGGVQIDEGEEGKLNFKNNGNSTTIGLATHKDGTMHQYNNIFAISIPGDSNSSFQSRDKFLVSFTTDNVQASQYFTNTSTASATVEYDNEHSTRTITYNWSTGKWAAAPNLDGAQGNLQGGWFSFIKTAVNVASKIVNSF